MNIRKKLSMSLLGIGLLGLSASAWAQGMVVVGRPYYGGYIPAYGYGYPGYSPNPALQNPGSPSNPAVLNYYMNGAPIPRGVVAPDPRFYGGGGDYYLY